MIEKFLKCLFDAIDYYLARQVPSKLGFGHQIDSRKRIDANTRFMHNLISLSNRKIKIMELACGRGVLAQELIQLPNIDYYLACDVDPDGIEVLRKRLEKDKNSSKIELKLMNCLEADIDKEGYFDVVIADKLLHLFSPDNIVKAFEFANKVLQPGGLFLINSASVKNFVYDRTVEEGDHKLYRRLKSDMMTRLWYNITTPYVFFITKDFIQEVSNKTGFSVIDNLICAYDEDYLTIAVCKNQPQPGL